MKSIKPGLRAWIGVTSIASFVGGWALFSHAGKPAPLFPSNINTQPAQAVDAAVAPAAIPTLAPIPSLDSLTQGSADFTAPSALQPLPSIQTIPQTSFPRMRTRGS